MLRLYRLLLQEIEQQVDEHGARKLVVDGRDGVADTVAAVEQIFAPALQRGPSATSGAERRRLLREANQAVVSQYQDYAARPWASRSALNAVSTFACECGSRTCAGDVELAITDFPGVSSSPAPVLTEGHTIDDAP